MTVESLIKQLRKYPKSTRVYMAGIDCDTIRKEKNGYSYSMMMECESVKSVQTCFDSRGKYIELSNHRQLG